MRPMHISILDSLFYAIANGRGHARSPDVADDMQFAMWPVLAVAACIFVAAFGSKEPGGWGGVLSAL